MSADPSICLTHLQSAILDVLAEEGQCYSMELIDHIRSREGWPIWRPQSNIYTALRVLEKIGLITSFDGDPVPERGGRPRRYYKRVQ